MEAWLPKQFTRAGMLPASSENCPQVSPPNFGNIKIIGLAEETEIINFNRDKPPLLGFSVLGANGQLDWYHNGSYTKTLASQQTFFFSAQNYGQQQIAVIDSHGNSDMISFQVSATN
jgi:penicillin-binding protein 1C